MKDFLHRGFTRRNLGRIASIVAGASALPFYNESALAQLSRVRDIPPDAVLINANETRSGPAPKPATRSITS
jgi:histidinol-phosphate aminotransferase